MASSTTISSPVEASPHCLRAASVAPLMARELDNQPFYPGRCLGSDDVGLNAHVNFGRYARLLRTMGIRLVRGRLLDGRDTASRRAPRRERSAARRIWPCKAHRPAVDSWASSGSARVKGPVQTVVGVAPTSAPRLNDVAHMYAAAAHNRNRIQPLSP